MSSHNEPAAVLERDPVNQHSKRDTEYGYRQHGGDEYHVVLDGGEVVWWLSERGFQALRPLLIVEVASANEYAQSGDDDLFPPHVVKIYDSILINSAILPEPIAFAER